MVEATHNDRTLNEPTLLTLDVNPILNRAAERILKGTIPKKISPFLQKDPVQSRSASSVMSGDISAVIKSFAKR